MSPEEQKEIERHSKAIAKILYKNTPKEELTSLGKIEEAVRERMQKYIMPEAGVFYQKYHSRKERIQKTNPKHN
jgi:hypothetical protein